jgi:hypothetical protein
VTTPTPREVARPSIASLLLETRVNGQALSRATGFVVERSGTRYLVTNWHVAAGRQPDNGQPMSSTGAVPDELHIVHNRAGQLGSWMQVDEPLYNGDGTPLWLEHPSHARNVDAVALPLTNTSGIDFYPYDPWAAPTPTIAFGIGGFLTIVGFPFGMTGGGALGIWVQGAVATEPSLDFNYLPCFLIDSRTRPGQSGSPVLAYRSGGAVEMEGGETAIVSGTVVRFLGIYSGRVHPDSDLGRVWKPSAITEIIEGAVRGSVA